MEFNRYGFSRLCATAILKSVMSWVACACIHYTNWIDECSISSGHAFGLHVLCIRLRPSDILFSSFHRFSETTSIQFCTMFRCTSAINWLEEGKKCQVSSCDFIHPIFIESLIFRCSLRTHMHIERGAIRFSRFHCEIWWRIWREGDAGGCGVETIFSISQ